MPLKRSDGRARKTSFRVPGGRHEFRVGAFGLRGVSSVLTRFKHSIFGRPALCFDSIGRAQRVASTPCTGPPTLGRFVQVYCDDILIFSKTREEHQVHVRMVLEIQRHRKLHAEASKSATPAAPRPASSATSSPSAASPSTPASSPPSRSGPRRRRAPPCAASSALPTTTVNISYAFLPSLPGCKIHLQPPCAVHTWGPAEQQSFDALTAALTSARCSACGPPPPTDASELTVSAILEQTDVAGGFTQSLSNLPDVLISDCQTCSSA